MADLEQCAGAAEPVGAGQEEEEEEEGDDGQTNEKQHSNPYSAAGH